ncbi:hypothetical protein ACVWXM_009496 [Bradyrhizobium sp. GM7.3]
MTGIAALVSLVKEFGFALGNFLGQRRIIEPNEIVLPAEKGRSALCRQNTRTALAVFEIVRSGSMCAGVAFGKRRRR